MVKDADNNRLPSLYLCIGMDILGMITYLIPFMAEWADVLWAPLSAFVFYRSFGGRTGRVGAVVNFIEEALPFLDVIPTFTIAYFYQRLYLKKSVKA